MAVLLSGILLLAAWPELDYLWRLNTVGSTFDRYLVTGDQEALAEAGGLLGLGDRVFTALPWFGPPAEGSDTDRASYWRLYGSVAARTPSEDAFRRLSAADRRGSLDRTGRLWLGEVAAATGHWEEAERSYATIDAANLLLARAEEAYAAGDHTTAARWYETAAASILTGAAEPAIGSPQQDDALLSGATGRATLLLQIGRGLLNVDLPARALPVLEHAKSEMHASTIGVEEQQSILFSLARALLLTSPPDADEGSSPRLRVLTLVDRALELRESGSSRNEEARIRLMMGDRREAVQALRESIRLDHRAPGTYLTLGAILEQDGLPSLARDLYGNAVGVLRGHPAIESAWAKTSYLTMTPREARPRLLRAAATATRDPYLFAALGDCLADLGDIEGARSAYREGLSRSPGAAPLIERLVELTRPTGETP
ncbi:MAG: hypothetical protein KKA32_07505 [Actinobacteria bacterium]|nr:hypothetical protein [Actinomycetota bacterium]